MPQVTLFMRFCHVGKRIHNCILIRLMHCLFPCTCICTHFFITSSKSFCELCDEYLIWSLFAVLHKRSVKLYFVLYFSFGGLTKYKVCERMKVYKFARHTKEEHEEFAFSTYRCWAGLFIAYKQTTAATMALAGIHSLCPQNFLTAFLKMYTLAFLGSETSSSFKLPYLYSGF